LDLIHRNIAINMGATKTEEFSVRDNKVAKYAKVLGHPARIAILRLLIKQDSCMCGDIVDELPLSQSTVSQHLKELKEAGLIKGDIDGVKICYCIDEKAWAEAKTYLTSFFEAFTNRTKCC
jgi:DNA-binding transcriptional ArsR family regulator